jgi:cell division septum initiation protein DivIVA
MACNETLEKEIKELKAKLAELDAALERKTKATTAASRK